MSELYSFNLDSQLDLKTNAGSNLVKMNTAKDLNKYTDTTGNEMVEDKDICKEESNDSDKSASQQIDGAPGLDSRNLKNTTPSKDENEKKKKKRRKRKKGGGVAIAENLNLKGPLKKLCPNEDSKVAANIQCQISNKYNIFTGKTSSENKNIDIKTEHDKSCQEPSNTRSRCNNELPAIKLNEADDNGYLAFIGPVTAFEGSVAQSGCTFNGQCKEVGISDTLLDGQCKEVGISDTLLEGQCKEVGISDTLLDGQCKEVGISDTLMDGQCKEVGISDTLLEGQCKEVGISDTLLDTYNKKEKMDIVLEKSTKTEEMDKPPLHTVYSQQSGPQVDDDVTEHVPGGGLLTLVMSHDTNCGSCSVDSAHDIRSMVAEKTHIGFSSLDTSQGSNVEQTGNGLLVDRNEVSSQLMIDRLHTQLHIQTEAMTRLQAHAHAQQAEANVLTTSLRARLRRRDNEMKRLQAQHEQLMRQFLSRVLLLEGQIKREHGEILELLQDKDDVIRRQKAAIEDLAEKNDRLLQVISQGYAIENGVTKAEHQVPGDVSIQDHGNKVVLRGNKTKNVEKVSSKVRFSAMKERLRRHKSSLELYSSAPLEPLDEGGLRYSSQENLVGRDSSHRSFERKERCRSLVDYPFGLRDVDENQQESPDSCFGDEINSPNLPNSVHSSTSSLVNLGDRTNHRQRPSSYGFNELSKSRSVPHALPTVSEHVSKSFRERPHSLPSVDLLAKDVHIVTSSSTSSATSVNTPTPAPPIPSQSPPKSSDSNPFQSIKNVFKRRGSKKKKAGISGSQDVNKEHSETLKQHFKKYNLT